MLLAMAFWPVSASAQNLMLFGKADFEMDWMLEPAGKLIRVRFSAATRRLRLEMQDGSDQVMLRDLAKGDVIVLIAQGTKGAYAQKGKPMGPFVPQEFGEVREIIGQKCRDIVSEGQKFCLTDDGIPLSVDLGSVRLVARALLKQAQPAPLFLVPKDIALKPMPGAGSDTVPKLPF